MFSIPVERMDKLSLVGYMHFYWGMCALFLYLRNQSF